MTKTNSSVFRPGWLNLLFRSTVVLIILLNTSTFAQVSVGKPKQVSGIVYNAGTKIPVSGAKVLITGTSILTHTNQKGYYKITVPAGKIELMFSDTTHNVIPQICYKTVTRSIDKTNLLNVYLIASIAYYVDTINYKVSAYKATTALGVLKKIPEFEIDTDNAVTHQGLRVTKVQINGFEVSGGIMDIIKNINVNKLQTIQVIDDYGNSAQLTSIKTGDPEKTLNFIAKDTILNTLTVKHLKHK